MKNKIINGSLMIIVLTMGSKVIALLRDSLMANTYGAEFENAAFIFSMRITMLLVSIGYGLTMAVIPTYSKILNEKGKVEQQKFLNNIITVSTIGSIVISLIGCVLAGVIVKVMASDLASDLETFNQAVLLMRIMFISIIFAGPQSVLAGVLQCHEKFLAPASMALCSNFIYLFYQLIFMKYFGIIGYGIAVVIGFLVMLLINIPSYKRLGLNYSYYVKWNDLYLEEVLKSLIPVIISSSLVQINLMILTSIAGSISRSSMVILDYSNKITMMFYEVFAIAINMVTYPILSNLKAQNKMSEYNKAFKEAIGYILLILLPVSLGVCLLRMDILSAYLMRGKFTIDLVYRAAEFILLLSPTIIILAFKDVVSRCFFSLNMKREIMKNSIYTILMTLVVTLLLSLRLGENALAIGYTLSSLATTIMLFLSLKKEISIQFNKHFLFNIFKMIVATIVMGIVVYIIRVNLIEILGFNIKSNIIILLTGSFVGIIVYGITTYVLGIKEVILFKDGIKKRKVRE